LSTIITDAVTALSGNLALAPEGSGVVTIDGLTYPAADGSASQLMKTNGSGVLSFVDAPSAGFTQSASQATTSGTSVTFGSIPSGTKMIVVNYFDVSSDAGESDDGLELTIGDAGGIETSGYISMRAQLRASGTGIHEDTTLWELGNHLDASTKWRGSAILTLQDVSAFRWICQWQTMDTANAATVDVGCGSKALSAELTQLKVETGTFDSGSISIMFQ